MSNHITLTSDDGAMILRSMFGNREFKEFKGTQLSVEEDDIVIYKQGDSINFYNCTTSATIDNIDDNRLVKWVGKINNIDLNNFENIISMSNQINSIKTKVDEMSTNIAIEKGLSLKDFIKIMSDHRYYSINNGEKTQENTVTMEKVNENYNVVNTTVNFIVTVKALFDTIQQKQSELDPSYTVIHTTSKEHPSDNVGLLLRKNDDSTRYYLNYRKLSTNANNTKALITYLLTNVDEFKSKTDTHKYINFYLASNQTESGADTAYNTLYKINEDGTQVENLSDAITTTNSHPTSYPLNYRHTSYATYSTVVHDNTQHVLEDNYRYVITLHDTKESLFNGLIEAKFVQEFGGMYNFLMSVKKTN